MWQHRKVGQKRRDRMRNGALQCSPVAVRGTRDARVWQRMSPDLTMSGVPVTVIGTMPSFASRLMSTLAPDFAVIAYRPVPPRGTIPHHIRHTTPH